MSVNSYLERLASDLVLKDSEKSSITTSINTIKSRLSSYFGNDVIEKFVFGSYTRGTILPRKADEKSDIDLMVVFDNINNYKPQTFLDKLKRFAEYYYSQSEIHQSHPTIILELNHIKFELVPAYTNYRMYFIPDKSGGWMNTDPNGFNDKLVECNKNNGYKIKPIVRLIKHWNIQKNNRKLESYLLEKKIADEMMYSYFSCYSYADYAKKALRVNKNYWSDTEIDTAIEHINKALEYESENMPYSAELEIKEVFPEVL